MTVDDLKCYFLPGSAIVEMEAIPRHQDVKDILIEIPLAEIKEAEQTTFFVSHRWESPGSPDDSNHTQLEAMKRLREIEYEVRGKESLFWYDYTSMPQKERTSEEDSLFHLSLRSLQDIIMECNVLVVLPGSEKLPKYLERGWCFAEVFSWLEKVGGDDYFTARSFSSDFGCGRIQLDRDKYSVSFMPDHASKNYAIEGLGYDNKSDNKLHKMTMNRLLTTFGDFQQATYWRDRKEQGGNFRGEPLETTVENDMKARGLKCTNGKDIAICAGVISRVLERKGLFEDTIEKLVGDHLTAKQKEQFKNLQNEVFSEKT